MTRNEFLDTVNDWYELIEVIIIFIPVSVIVHPLKHIIFIVVKIRIIKAFPVTVIITPVIIVPAWDVIQSGI